MRIGLVLPTPSTEKVATEAVTASGHEPVTFPTLSHALAERPRVVFAEWVSGEKLADLLRGLKQTASMENPIPVVVLVPPGGVAAMRRARAAGAAAVLFSPPDPEEFLAEIEDFCSASGALEPAARQRLEAVLQDSLIGESPQFRECLGELRTAAQSDANVLIVGETGTGKEEFARGIHLTSRRFGDPYVAVNCGGLAAGVLESELFGHVRGAFTDAKGDRTGRFQAVGAGTLLLDEIGDMEPGLQVKLLRVIEHRVFQRVGDNADIRFRARLICSTCADLEARVADGRFRRDLLGRINQLRIALPPLRERRADITALARHFLKKHAHDRRIDISRTAMEVLDVCDYPMNVRQLENAIISATARLGTGTLILPQHLPDELLNPSQPRPKPSGHLVQVPEGMSYADARTFVCRAIDEKYLTELLDEHGGNKSRAAEAAGLDRKTFRTRLDEATQDPEDPAGS